MLAALSKRSARLALAAVIGTLTIYVLLYQPTGVVPASLTGSGSQEFRMQQFDTYTVSEYAHRLAYADDFFGHPLKDEGGRYQNGHFDNITALPKITLAQSKAACQWDDITKVNFAFGEDSGWGLDLSWVKNDRKEPEVAKYRKLIYRFIHDKDKTLAYYDNYADRFMGRGIVIVGGQGRSLKRVRVILRQLKKLGCKLPVELHYWGAEMDSNARRELATMWHDITFSNIAAPSSIVGSTYNRAHGIHYHLKVAALVNARFEDILLLDSDNIPVINPEELFDSPTYQEYGTVFWPDIQRTRRNNPIFPITNTECTSTHEWELESGQLMVNKKKFFYHLQLAAWFIDPRVEHSAYWLNLMLGDKDTFRFAWHALKTKFGTPKKWITSVGTLNDGYYCGHTFAQHHPDDGRVAFLHGGLLKTMRKEVVIWQKEANGGVFQAYKRDPFDEDKKSNPKVGIKWDGQEYLPNRPADMEIQWCTDFEEVEPRPIAEIVPQFTDADFEEIGGYWMMNETSHFSITDGNL